MRARVKARFSEILIGEDRARARACTAGLFVSLLA
jgi:hypothetical protein